MLGLEQWLGKSGLGMEQWLWLGPGQWLKLMASVGAKLIANSAV